VEGYMDVIALYQAGIQNVVASSGTALTVEQIRLIKRFSKNVLLIYDADRAGIKAAMRGVDLLLEQELSVKVLLLPEGEDPDSYVKTHGKSGFETFAKEQAQDFIDFKIGLLFQQLDFGDPDQKTQAIHETAQTLARIPDPVKQAVYIDKAAGKLGVTADIMGRSLNRALADRAKLEQRQKGFQQRQAQLSMDMNEPPPGYVPPEFMVPSDNLDKLVGSPEHEMIRIMLNYPDQKIDVEGDPIGLVEFLAPILAETHFEPPVLEKFKAAFLQIFGEKGHIDLNHFINHQDREISRIATQMLTIPYEVSANWEKFDIRAPKIDEDLGDVVTTAMTHFRRNHLRRLYKECQAKIQTAAAAGNNSEVDKNLKIIQSILQMNHEINTERGIVIILESN
ncbi:MAG: toprim domain-containing protein, partial [Bacteroidota bacterium]